MLAIGQTQCLYKHDLISSSQQHYDVCLIIFLTLETRRLRFREDKSHTQSSQQVTESQTQIYVNPEPNPMQMLQGISDRKSHRGLVDSQSTIKGRMWGAWVAQSVGCPTSAQVMISQSMSSSPASGSVLTAQSLEPASDSVSSSLSAPPLLILCLSLSQKQIKTF